MGKQSFVHQTLSSQFQGDAMPFPIGPTGGQSPWEFLIQDPFGVTATAVAKDADLLFLSAQILRDGEKVTLADTVEHVNGAHYAFAPLYEVWKKPIPEHWGELPKGADGVRKED